MKNYYNLIKPGIVYANTLTAIAGYLFASRFHIQFLHFIGLIFGTATLIASACVFNNYLDIPIDKLMERTAKRELVINKVSKISAKIFIVILFIVAITLLITLTNLLTSLIGVLAYFFYVFVYGYFKRYSVYGTLVGSLPGAASIVAGYLAYKNSFTVASLILAIIMITWQMAHFYAIAIFRYQDYKRAKIPVWPVVKGVKNTVNWIIAYMALFLVANILLDIFGSSGVIYFIIMLLTSYWWMYVTVISIGKISSELWAKKVFKNSLYVNIIFIVTLSATRL